jgi:hypothetical protein
MGLPDNLTVINAVEFSMKTAPYLGRGNLCRQSVTCPQRAFATGVGTSFV